MRPHREHHLGGAARAIHHGGQDQSGGVQHGAQRAHPRFVVVRRAEVGEYRVGQMAIEHLGCPFLPVGEQPWQVVDHAKLVHRLQQVDAGGRRAGPGVERHDQDLPALKGSIQRKQKADGQRDRAEAGAAGNQG